MRKNEMLIVKLDTSMKFDFPVGELIECMRRCDDSTSDVYYLP